MSIGNISKKNYYFLFFLKKHSLVNTNLRRFEGRNTKARHFDKFLWHTFLY